MSLKIDEIVAFGISHKELTTEEREIFIQQNPAEIINKLFLEKKIGGYINLSTCLRIEFYLQLINDFSTDDLLSTFKIKKGISLWKI